MTDQVADLDEALEELVSAARVHLAAVRAAGGAVDDEHVWRSYVALNNASFAYDQLLLEQHGEVTPWETEPIDLQRAENGTRTPFLTRSADVALGDAEPDPHPAVISVRQRRDYRVPSLSALLAVAADAAQRTAFDDESEVERPETVADAVLELVRTGDGSLSGLDVPELEPLAGVVTVSEVSASLDLDTESEAALFAPGDDDQLIGRVDEEPYPAEAPGDGDPQG